MVKAKGVMQFRRYMRVMTSVARQKGIVRALAAAALVGALVGVAGPFGSYTALDWPIRVAYWALISLVATGLGFGVNVTVAKLVGRARARWLRDLVALSLFAATFAPLLYVGTSAFLPQESFHAVGLPRLLLLVCLIGIVLTLARVVIFDMHRSGSIDTSDKTPTPIRLRLRLPREADADVIHIKSEDHYVVLRLRDGTSHRLLMRLTDAIDEMDGVSGVRSHRSHWVALSGVDALETRSDKVWIVLTSGDRVPVSKKYRNEVLSAVPANRNAVTEEQA